MEERKRRGGVVGPLILISIGLIFLLNNLGVLDWSIWGALWRLWPILLIAVGLDILIGWRSGWGALLVLVLTVGLLIGGLFLLVGDLGTDRALSTEQIRQPLQGAAKAAVTVDPGIGWLRVGALPESAVLVEGEVALGKQEGIEGDFAIEGDKATYVLRTDRRAFGPTWGWDERRLWDLGLARNVPLALAVELGAGKAELDLADLTLSDLTVDLGVGKAEVVLPRRGAYAARIDAAIGSVTVVVPDGLAVRVRADTPLGVRDLPEGYQLQDDAYTSPGYDRADDRVDLEVGLAIGKVEIRQAEAR
jgi:hypothetical protein